MAKILSFQLLRARVADMAVLVPGLPIVAARGVAAVMEPSRAGPVALVAQGLPGKVMPAVLALFSSHREEVAVAAREQPELLAQPQFAAMAGQGSHLQLAAQALLTQEVAAVERLPVSLSVWVVREVAAMVLITTLLLTEQTGLLIQEAAQAQALSRQAAPAL
jgi:hypothetical protein